MLPTITKTQFIAMLSAATITPTVNMVDVIWHDDKPDMEHGTVRNVLVAEDNRFMATFTKTYAHPEHAPASVKLSNDGEHGIFVQLFDVYNDEGTLLSPETISAIVQRYTTIETINTSTFA